MRGWERKREGGEIEEEREITIMSVIIISKLTFLQLRPLSHPSQYLK